ALQGDEHPSARGPSIKGSRDRGERGSFNAQESRGPEKPRAALDQDPHARERGRPGLARGRRGAIRGIRRRDRDHQLEGHLLTGGDRDRSLRGCRQYCRDHHGETQLVGQRDVPSRHALIFSVIGAAVSVYGLGVIIAPGLQLTVFGIGYSPVVAFLFGYGLMLALYWGLRNVSYRFVNRFFGRAQIVSSAYMAFSH